MTPIDPPQRSASAPDVPRPRARWRLLLIAGRIRQRTGKRPPVVRSLAATLLLAISSIGVTACGAGSLNPEDVRATGQWVVHIGVAESGFTFNLQEGADGIVTGTWSNLEQFYRYPVSGRREGLKLFLTADSPNIFMATLSVVFQTPSSLEGILDFGNAHYEVTLTRK